MTLRHGSRAVTFLTRSFHKRQDDATACRGFRGVQTMKSAARLAVLGLFALGLAACASQAQQDYTPPPSKRLDAKTTLEKPNQRR